MTISAATTTICSERHDVNNDKVRCVLHETAYHPAEPLDLKSVERLMNSSAEQSKQLCRESSQSRAASYNCDKSSFSAANASVAAVPTHVVTKSSTTEVRVRKEPIKKIVLPFDGVDDVDGCRTTPLFEPQPERLLDREMRAVCERERALRLVRGLTTTLDDEVRRSVEVQVGVVKPDSCADDMVERREREHDALPKRYAESRVRAELRRDRQREMELRSCGVVRSISDRPTGHQREVIDVFSSETPLTSKRRPASAAARRSADGFVAVDRHAQPYKHAAIKVDKDASAEATDIADRRSPVVPSVLRTYEYPSYPERQNSVTNDTLVTSTLVSPRHASNRRSLSTENERLSSGLSSLITSLLVEV